MSSHEQRRPGTALLCALGLVAAGCGFDPEAAPREYELNADVVEQLEQTNAPPHLAGQILGVLGMLYGTPAAPAYLRTEEWVDDGFDPNWPHYPAGEDGSGSISDEQWAAIQEDNLERFDPVIEALEEHRFDEIPGILRDLPRGKGLLPFWEAEWEYYTEAEGFDSDEEFAGATIDRFTNYYPSFAESAELYRIQCLHCHGNEGGADGPTADFLDPRPRDYRRGIFKYTALKDKARPRREDLYNTLDEGIYTTAMPSFRRFSDAELHGLVDYVQLLAMRGETEVLLAANLETGDPLTTDLVLETYTDVWDRWTGQDEKFVAFEGEIPEPTAELLARGEELFEDPNKGNCFSCHGVDGRGNGPAAWNPAVDDEGNPLVDENGEPLHDPWTGLPMVEPAYLDDWGYPIVPRDLTNGVFRFGRRPIDIYRRIYSGINGTPMPAIGESKDADGNPLLSDTDMWAVVHYVRSLSENEHMRPLRDRTELTHEADEDDHQAASPDGEHGEESTH